MDGPFGRELQIVARIWNIYGKPILWIYLTSSYAYFTFTISTLNLDEVIELLNCTRKIQFKLQKSLSFWGKAPEWAPLRDFKEWVS